jgi:hypothetical protein
VFGKPLDREENRRKFLQPSRMAEILISFPAIVAAFLLEALLTNAQDYTS